MVSKSEFPTVDGKYGTEIFYKRVGSRPCCLGYFGQGSQIPRTAKLREKKEMVQRSQGGKEVCMFNQIVNGAGVVVTPLKLEKEGEHELPVSQSLGFDFTLRIK